MDKFQAIIQTQQDTNKLTYLSNSLTYILITIQNLDNNRIKYKEQYKETCNKILGHLKHISDNKKGLENDYNFDHAYRDVIIENLKDSQKFIDDNDEETKQEINLVIKKIISYTLIEDRKEPS